MNSILLLEILKTLANKGDLNELLVALIIFINNYNAFIIVS